MTKIFLKGQVISSDFIIGFIIFTVIFIFFQVEWSGVSASNPFSQASAANLALDRLLETPGIPLNWELNSSNASSIGIVLTPNVISDSKLQAFLSICNSSYDSTRSLIGLENYDFQFQISSQFENASCGPAPKTSSITYLSESVLWDSNISTVKLVVWP